MRRTASCEKHYPILTKAMSHEIYVYARDLLPKQFGNMFQLSDLWNSNIPTIEDYGQWLTKQMFMFNSDLLTGPQDTVDPKGVATHVYRFAPELMAMLGVRYIISDGALNGSLITEVMRETSPTETTILRLYEVQNAKFLGIFSPTKVVTADSYDDAVPAFTKFAGPGYGDFAQTNFRATRRRFSPSSAPDCDQGWLPYRGAESGNLAPGLARAVFPLLAARRTARK